MPRTLPPPLPVCEHGLPPAECEACRTEADATADPRDWEAAEPPIPTDVAADPVGVPYH